MTGLKDFHKQQYLNLETFRKNGEGVKTPVWFVEHEGTLYVWTGRASGKVKRILRSRGVRVTPSTGSGQPLAEWQDAEAVVDETPAGEAQVAAWMRQKYGWMYRFLRWRALRTGAHYVALAIRLAQPA